MQEDFDFAQLKRGLPIEVVIIQSKTTKSFDERSIDKLISFTNNVFQLDRKITSFEKIYNNGVLSLVEDFRKLYTSTASLFPNLKISYFYVTFADSNKVHQKVKKKQMMNLLALSRNFFLALNIVLNF